MMRTAISRRWVARSSICLRALKFRKRLLSTRPVRDLVRQLLLSSVLLGDHESKVSGFGAQRTAEIVSLVVISSWLWLYTRD